jgi:hypothetical protein
MHLVLQEHTKWLLRQLFFSDRDLDYYVGHHIAHFNKLLSEIKTPHTFNRKVDSIQANLKYKSSELKVLIFTKLSLC